MDVHGLFIREKVGFSIRYGLLTTGCNEERSAPPLNRTARRLDAIEKYLIITRWETMDQAKVDTFAERLVTEINTTIELLQLLSGTPPGAIKDSIITAGTNPAPRTS